MIIIEVRGGCIEKVHGTDDYEVLDWDNLLGDEWSTGDTQAEWDNLYEYTQQFIIQNYPKEYVQIQERIALDLKADD